jgi:DNA-directed RNA polymerase specialized sigma24 family protein
LLGDEAELFQAFHPRLRRIVQSLVNTSPDIVDDACNYAWMEFIRHQPDRDRSWKAWLVTTAQREAWKLDGQERSNIGFEVDGDRVPQVHARAHGPLGAASATATAKESVAEGSCIGRSTTSSRSDAQCHRHGGVVTTLR